MLLASRLVKPCVLCAQVNRSLLSSRIILRRAVQQKVILGGALTEETLNPRVKKRIGIWLLGCAGMVFGAVTLGGITRLTESGLSMVEWNLIKGMKPPLSQKQWADEFEKYKQYPEYSMKTDVEEMSLGQFQFIWSMEYLHRMWGRAIGLAFLIPAGVFWYNGHFTRAMKKRVTLAGGLLVFQGLLGWYMVRSGLDPSKNTESIPRVSQYRLAAHLSSAIVLYTILLWTGLSHVLKPFDHTAIAGIKHVRWLAHSSKTFMFLTAVAGAFVAGLDAGLVWNSWPKFGDDWLPSDMWNKEPWYRNFLDNPAMVQLVHRELAYTTLGLVTATWLVGRRLKLPPRTRFVLHSLMAMGYIQAAIGILTLIHYVPVWLGAAHQNGNMILMTFGFWLTNELRRIPK